ncbi:MAG TPA: ABC transporter permease [Opitutaceae bacterium]
MLPTLLAKDLRRAWRNSIRWAISLLIPLIVTALIGLAFSPRTGGGLGRIKLRIVDEDESVISRSIRGMPNQQKRQDDIPFEIELEILELDEAMRRITNNELAAVVIFPRGFTSDTLKGDVRVALEVVKNPAQAIHPAVVEESLSILVGILDAASRVLGKDIAEWRALLTDDDAFVVKLLIASQLLKDTSDRLTPVKEYLFPPLVSYTRETRDATAAEDSGPQFNLFAYLLIGMAAMFLLYMADNAMRDLYREEQARTLGRFRTQQEGLAVLVASKVVFALAVLLMGAAVLFGGGALLFQITRQRPLALVVLIVCDGFFAAGFLGLVAALAGTGRRADNLDNILFLFGLAANLAAIRFFRV